MDSSTTAPPPPPFVDPRSGFCPSTSSFHSLRPPLPLPVAPALDVSTFISSRPHLGTTALIDASTGRRVSFSSLWSFVDALSASLSAMGFRKGHVVLLLSPNSLSFPVVSLAVLSLGAVLTTCNPLNTPREISKQVADSGARLAFVTPELVHKVSDLGLPVVLIDEDGRQSEGGQRVVNTLSEMLRRRPAGSSRAKDVVYQDDTATLLYSSGTTGASKGVISSHRNLIAMVQIVLNRFNLDRLGEQRFVCTVPMYHIYGLAAFATGLLASGATIIILSKFDMHEMLLSIGKYRATYLPLVPPILVAMINNADKIRKGYDLSSLQWVLSGGAPLSKELIEGFAKEFGDGVGIMQGYGLTETAGVGASTDTLEEVRRYGTAGKLSAGMEARVVDPDSGRILGVNQTGELWLRGPTVMKGYFSNPEATTSTLDSDGWLRTGDLCYIDDDGFIFVVDRLKELIKYKGYQVPPAELEALLLTHPLIADSAVIPFPDKEVGQYPIAYVVRKPRSEMSEKEVIEFVAKQVAPYKRIRRVTFIDSIPKNPSGKILRKDLIKLATSKI
ncbi:hypothetical protein MLD38_022166 [Melastoma candidum]|uniref:Uncharacterized protein n=1 Tax=Melastoma candidum TaxID=119954 RepID=A0ACB9QIG9_9MYRT|nr:hypothetical protein MLD38_022166 [Melastoma candidum]